MGTGTTVPLAKPMGRQFIGIDIEARLVSPAEERVGNAVPGDQPILLVRRPKYPTKDELERLAEIEAASPAGSAKHKRKT
jgi:DNA modification methylase